MPVAVSLETLVTLPSGLPAWPEEFRALIANLEEQPDESTAWLVVADWLKENDEREMESACRWFVKHVEVTASRRGYDRTWWFDGLSDTVKAGDTPPGDTSTLAGAIAVLAARIRRAREAVA